MSLQIITELSQKYGSDSEYVLAGEGNTSYKDDEFLYVKPSGIFLKDIQEKDFVKIDREKIKEVFEFESPADAAEREDAVKRIMAYAVVPGSKGRPSVEAPLHDAISYKYVVHLHPAKVNGMTCGKNGKEACAEMFPEALWVDYIDPGYTLAVCVKDEIAKFAEKNNCCPKVIFLKNHGVFVGADSEEEINSIYSDIMGKLDFHYTEKELTTKLNTGSMDSDTVLSTAPRLRSVLGDNSLRKTILSSDPYKVAPEPLTPDHIVYAGSFALEADPNETLDDEIAKFTLTYGRNPLVVSLSDKAVFYSGDNLKNAVMTMALAKDAGLVMQLTEAFGGPSFLAKDSWKFIENWEVESYRKKASSSNSAGKLAGKIAIVTGGAQGFGYGIAEGLVREGATVAIADMNIEGAREARASIEEKFGTDRVLALKVNIADETSVEKMMEKIVMSCGGIDLFIANAGVLRAGSVKTFEKNDWDFVTNINYTGYYLCVKHVAKVMAEQNVAGGAWTDIVQVNSKSGLVGSNRNAAYAASKFGTIGQTQSFAMELIEDKIKVNSVCPGNFFDGPLWCDREKGLFVQYLKSNKVPGAETIEDVKKFYESKVPMNRGCLPEDVVKAIVYCVSQEYETGQAIPVSGGQVMLN